MTGDKIGGKVEHIKGEAREGYGKATGDKEAEARGKAEQVTGSIKQGVASLKEKAREVFDRNRKH